MIPEWDFSLISYVLKDLNIISISFLRIFYLVACAQLLLNVTCVERTPHWINLYFCLDNNCVMEIEKTERPFVVSL